MIPRYSPKDIAAIWTEEAKLQRWLDIELAAVEARVKLGEVPEQDYAVIKKKARFDVARILEIEKTTKHDVIAFLTNVAEYVGAESRHIHQGMTSSDVLDTALSMQMRDAGNIILVDIERLIKILAKRAKEFKYTLQIGRTHGVHAEPITFGLKLALWYEEMKRNRERLKRAIEVVSVGKVSGAVGTFEHLSPKVEEYVCKKLGLKPAPISTQIIQRDRHAEYLCTLAVIASSIEKFSVECRHLQRTEVLEAEEFFSEGQKGSSAMPHKRNPITFERLSGLARVIRANALAGLENVALWHERDISHSSVERVFFPDAFILSHYAIRRLNQLLTRLVVQKDRMKLNVESSQGLLMSSHLLLLLIDKGLSREEAYSRVQSMSFEAKKSGVHLRNLIEKNDTLKEFFSKKELEELFSGKRHLKHQQIILNRVLKRK